MTRQSSWNKNTYVACIKAQYFNPARYFLQKKILIYEIFNNCF